MEAKENTNSGDASQYTLEHIEGWVAKLVKNRDWSSKRATDYLSCLRAFAKMRGEEEPVHLAWFRENIDLLVQRYTLDKGGTGETTAQNYRGKAMKAIEWFLEVQVTGVLPAKARPSSRNGSSSKKKPKKTAVEETPPEVATEPDGLANSGSVRMFPLAAGGEIRFTVPDGGLEVQDVNRFFAHLMTLTKNFDPISFFPGLPAAPPPAPVPAAAPDLELG